MPESLERLKCSLNYGYWPYFCSQLNTKLRKLTLSAEPSLMFPRRRLMQNLAMLATPEHYLFAPNDRPALSTLAFRVCLKLRHS